MHFTLNWRYLLRLAAITGLAGLAVHLVHGWQSRKQVGAFLHQADTALEAGDAEREARYLPRYLASRPGDLDARERFGRRLCQSAKTARDALEGYLTVEEVLRQDPAREALRRFAVDFAMSPPVGMYAEARGDLDVLLAAHPGDGELEELYARSLAETKKYTEAAGMYGKAVKHRPDRVDAYAGQAFLLRWRLNRPDEADQAIADLLEQNAREFRAHLVAAGYWRSAGGPRQPAAVVAQGLAKAQKLAPAESVGGATARAVQAARALAPDELDVLLFAAEVARARSLELAAEGKPAEAEASTGEARQLLARALERDGKSTRAYLAMAAFVADTKAVSGAVEVINRGRAAIPDSVELTAALLDYQIRAGDTAGAGETLAQLRARGLPAAQADYQQARILAASGEWLDASRLLDRLRRDVADSPDLVRQLSLLLGRCFEQLGEPDRRLAAYRDAVPVDSGDPLWLPALLGLAQSEISAGRVDAALATYRKLADRAAGAWVPIARLEIARALRVAPPAKPDWAAAEDALARAARAVPDSTEVALLRADLASLQDKRADARRQLEDLRRKRPKEAAVWIALAEQDRRDGDLKGADATLAAATGEAGNSPEIRVARARVWAEMRVPDLSARIDGLAAVADQFDLADRRRFLRGLAEVAAAGGAADAAGRLWEQLAGVYRWDLGVHLVRFDRAVRADDEAAMDRVLGDIRRVDGEGGTSTRLARALICLWAARHKGDRTRLDEALALFEGLGRERSGWGRAALGRALVLDERGDVEAALVGYEQAIDFGEADPNVLRRLAELLAKKGRFDRADEILSKLPDAATAGGAVSRLVTESSLRVGDTKRALEFAAKAVSPDSKVPEDQLWLGRVRWAAGDRAGAEGPFRKAADLRPEAADGWLALIQYLVATGRRGEAETVQQVALGKAAPADRPLLAALGAARLGTKKQATEEFRRARDAKPDDLRTTQAEAEFLFRTGQLGEAREAFQRVIGLQSASAGDKEFARNMLAICLAADRDYQTSRRGLEALGLVQDDSVRQPDGDLTPAQRRARAVVLALQRDRASKLEAIRLLEEMRDGLTASDRFLLAQQHRDVGNRTQVRVVMSELLRTADKVPLYVGFYASWLLAEGDLSGAEEWVGRLAESDPDALPTAELKARLFAAKKDPAAARTVLRAKAAGKGSETGRIAAVCDELGFYDDAEHLLKQLGDEQRATNPRAALALAAFYGRRGRTAEALRVCEEARPRVPAEVVGQVAVQVLYAAPAPAAGDLTRVAGWLEDAAKTSGEGQAALLQEIAALRNLQGDYQAAADLFRRAVEMNGKDVVAMNNLAFLLSVRDGKHDEALRLLDRAKLVIGPTNPTLRDTEALVRLNKGEPVVARSLLEGVVAQAPIGSSLFHLAQAELAVQRELEARVAWKRAAEAGLRRADLHPLERPAYDRLVARLGN